MSEGSIIAITVRPEFIEDVVSAEGDAHKTHRACFNLAITLTHELAHAVWYFTRSLQYRKVLPGNIEPRMTKNFPSCPDGWELGFQWTQSVLGVIPWPSTGESIGLKRLLWLPLSLVACDDDKLFSMGYIDQWFRKETWEAIKQKGRKGVPEPRFCGTFSVVKKAWTEEEVWELLV